MAKKKPYRPKNLENKPVQPSVEKLVTYNLRVSDQLREAFNLSCKGIDSTGSQEIRKFMRDFVKRHGQQKLL